MTDHNLVLLTVLVLILLFPLIKLFLNLWPLLYVLKTPKFYTYFFISTITLSLSAVLIHLFSYKWYMVISPNLISGRIPCFFRSYNMQDKLFHDIFSVNLLSEKVLHLPDVSISLLLLLLFLSLQSSHIHKEFILNADFQDETPQEENSDIRTNSLILGSNMISGKICTIKQAKELHSYSDN